MIELKTVIDKNGYIVDDCVEIEDGKTNYFTMTEGQKTVDKYSNVLKYVKPKWKNNEWVEGATEEEIQAWKEENKVEVNTGENLIDKLILDNINMQTQIDNLILANLGGN